MLVAPPDLRPPRGLPARSPALLVAPLVFRAPEGPAAVCAGGRRPAREPSAPRAYGSARRLEARPGPAAAHGRRSPPVPSGPSGALLTGGAWLLMCGSVRCLEARPGPATAHRTSAT